MMFWDRARTGHATGHDCFDVLRCLVSGDYYVVEHTHSGGDRITTKVTDRAAADRLVAEHRAQHDTAYHQH